jgi:hypothetical protein
MRRRYLDPDYSAALCLLSVIFVAGLLIGLLVAWVVEKLI